MGTPTAGGSLPSANVTASFGSMNSRPSFSPTWRNALRLRSRRLERVDLPAEHLLGRLVVALEVASVTGQYS